jgi:phosphoinositide-3-kinase, regulatory subunit 4
LFDALVGLAAYLGSATTEEYILPLMMQSLMDPEEHVIQSILHSLAEIAKLGLLSRASMVEQVETVARFTMHPNLWVREAAADFIASAAAPLSPAELRVLLLPQTRPYLKIGMLPEVSETILLDSLKRPLPRSVFDQALVWASKSDRGMFWKPLQKLSSNFVTSISGALGRSGQTPTGPGAINRLARNDEDEQWLSKLRNLGLSPEDEAKLLGLREFIWRLSQMQARDARDTPDTEIDGKISKVDFTKIVPLNTQGVKIHTIMFEEPRDAVSEAAEPEAGAPRTIADALLDASMTVDDPMGRRRRAALNSHRSRLNSRQELSPSPAEVNRKRMSDTTNLVLLKGDATSKDIRRTSSPRNAAEAAAGNTTNSTDSGASSPLSERRAMRHQSSAMNLLGRTDSVKSGPETGTTEANVFGRMEAPFSAAHASPADAEQDADVPIPRVRVAHSYAGNDPDIIKMLDSMYLDNYPHDIAEFGPLVSPVSRRRSGVPSRHGSEQTAWKPSGKLLATFAEHVGAINRLVVSPDHAFFVTGGDDGSVKVWDTGRLEKNITQRSRQTHRHPAGSKVLALCFIENTHCFVSCASDGSVHVVKTDFAIYNDTVRYSKPRLLRDYQLPQDEFAVWCEHFKQESSSVLVLATNRSRVLGIDLRTMAQLFVLENPVHHGTPTSFCMDRKRNWLCLATSHGVLDLWDLRFKMRIKAWGIPGKHTIYRLSIHPTKGRGKWVCAAGGTGQGEVTVWDVEKALCREVYRVGGNKETPKGYEAWEVDQDRPEGMLGRFATNIAAQAADGPGAMSSSNADRGVRAMLLATGQAEDQREVRHAFMLTGGSDRKLRFWDLARIENSTVFSGLLPEEGRPSYSASQVTTSLMLNVERLPRSGGGGGSSGAAEGGKAAKSASKAPRSTVISLQSQQLLKSHLDAITDVALIEVPYTMVVSVDRSGVIFVFA